MPAKTQTSGNRPIVTIWQKRKTQMPPPVSHNSLGRRNKSMCSGRKKTFFSAECRVSCAFSEVCFGYGMLQSCSCRVQGESSRKRVIVDAAISQSAWQKDFHRRRNYIALHTCRTVAPGLSVPCVPSMFRNPHKIFKCLRTWYVHPVSHSNYRRRKKLVQE